MGVVPVLINGEWRNANHSDTFQAENPAKKEHFGEQFPISNGSDLGAALDAAQKANVKLRKISGKQRAAFLDAYAGKAADRIGDISQIAHKETALPLGRLSNLEGISEASRMVGQLRQGAEAARTYSWANPIIDTATNTRSMRIPAGTVALYGPNNFPLAFNGMSGGDFAAAIAAGNSVIVKGHPSHPGTSYQLALAAHDAAVETGMPSGMIQFLFDLSPDQRLNLVAPASIAAVGFTGSAKVAKILSSARKHSPGTFYGEVGSINPVFIGEGALEENLEGIAGGFVESMAMGVGQFCTNPGFVVVYGSQADAFVEASKERYAATADGTLLSKQTLETLRGSVKSMLGRGGATVVTGGEHMGMANGKGPGYSYANTLLTVSGDNYLANPEKFQHEMFGPASLVVTAADEQQAVQIAHTLSGMRHLTRTIHTHSDGRDNEFYGNIDAAIKAGRGVHNGWPTGVAVVASMHHGYADGETSVGIPGSIRRFTHAACYTNTANELLPPALQNNNPLGIVRQIDGMYTKRQRLIKR